MRKNIIKISLDVIMFLLLLLLFNKRVINMQFHEIGGLLVCGMFLIHKALNWEWIVEVTRRIFDRNLPKKIRIGYYIDVLLFVFFAIIAISGIMISKTIFTSISSNNILWKVAHYFSTAVAIILIGVHIGLHMKFIKMMLSKIIHIPQKVAMPLCVFFISFTMLYGLYNIVTTDFGRWISMPFTIQANDKGHSEQREFSQGKMQERGPGGMTEQQGQPHKQNGMGNQPNDSIHITSILSQIISFGSIILLFAFLTVFVEYVAFNRKKKVQQPIYLE